MWEDRYSKSEDYLFGTAPAQFLRENPGWLVPGRSALCVADGEGRNSVHLARCGLDVTAFDLSPTAVERARALAAENGVSANFNVSDWDAWRWDDPAYDLVVAIFIQFAGPSERGQQFANLKSAVKPGGVLMLHGYRPEQIELGTGGPPFAENMYTEEILRKYFGNWRIERLAGYERDVQEGRGHSGKSALIDLIAREPDRGLLAFPAASGEDI
ncbi:MAG TPA: class I SAM-dependent methyltransferase [Rhodobacteraceae bacterium]|nr:class I SAM-dependent methyltransferase [Paracoccaceae bacterium]